MVNILLLHTLRTAPGSLTDRYRPDAVAASRHALQRTLALVLVLEQRLEPRPILHAHIAGKIALGIPDLLSEAALGKLTFGIRPTQPRGFGIGIGPRERGMAENLCGQHTIDRLGESVVFQVANQRFRIKVGLRSMGF